MPYKDSEKAKEYNKKWSKKYYHKHKNDESFKEKRRIWGKNTRKKCNADIKRKEIFDEKRKEYQRTHRKQINKNAEKWREKNREKLLLYYKNWRENHRQQSRDAVKRCRQKNYPKLKREVLIHYGGNPPKCACCGETIIEFLTIDHIHGGGNKQRKQLGFSGSGVYIWLKKNGFPKGYQVLCYNCNCGRARNNNICPHKTNNGCNLEPATRKNTARW